MKKLITDTRINKTSSTPANDRDVGQHRRKLMRSRTGVTLAAMLLAGSILPVWEGVNAFCDSILVYNPITGEAYDAPEGVTFTDLDIAHGVSFINEDGTPWTGSSSASTDTSSASSDTGTSVSSSQSSTQKSHTHTWDGGTVTLQPTCTTEGEKTYTCTDCGETKTESIDTDPQAHSYTDGEITEPTCTEAGKSVKTCEYCGDTVETTIDPLGHDYKAEVTTEPTCTEAGETTYTCSRCGDSYTEPIDALGHDSGKYVVTKEASTFFDGSQDLVCRRCGEVLSTEETASKYPSWVLFAIIGGAVVLIGAVAGIIIARKKKPAK